MISKLTTPKTVWSKSDLPLAYQTELFETASYQELKDLAKALKREKYAFDVLSNEFENLTTKKFFKLYKRFYSWNNKEIKDRLLKKEIKSGEHLTIKTFDIAPYHTKEGYGSQSYWTTNYFYADYKIYAKKGMVNPDFTYTKEQIADMVKNKLLVVEEIEPSNRFYSLKNVEWELERLSQISLESPITKLDEGFNFEHYHIESERLQQMTEQNPEVLDMIRAEFSKQRLEKDYQSYLKQYEQAKRCCFKNAYKLIEYRKHIIDKENKEIESLKSSIKNM